MEVKMNNKTKLILGLVFLIFISMSAVSANENTTDAVAYDEEYYDDYYDEWEDDYEDDDYTAAVVSANNYNSIYDSGKKIAVQVKDEYGSPLRGVDVAVSYDTGRFDSDYTDSNGKAYFKVYEKVGNHQAYVFINEDNYDGNTVLINVKVTKAPVKLAASKITAKTNKYANLKVTVKDKWGYNVNQGTVKFKINGKTYSVKVKNGVAAKKIKLTKAKTYTYKAIFSAKNYKSETVSSKVVVKKPAKMYIYKKGKYSFKVSAAQQKKIKYVKNHKYSSHLSTYADFKVKTGKYHNGMPVYAVVTTWSGIQSGHYYNYPQVQFVTMYGPNTWDWDYLTVNYKL